MRTKKLLEAQQNALRAIEGMVQDLVARNEALEKSLEKLADRVDDLERADERPEDVAQRLYMEGIANVLNYEVGVKVSGR